MVGSSSSSNNISFTLLHLIAVFALTSRCSCATTDSLLPNQSIQDGETLVSMNGTFELGFFSPGASSNRYVGVWYHKIPNRTVVWVANRNSPLVDSSGSLIINYDGDLMILDGKGSSITLADSSGLRDVKAAILDSGNFVLSESGNSSNILWQSFDDPTDTWLPGMKIGLFGRQNRLLTSWRSNDDPFPGDFSFGTDPNGAKQLFTWQNEKVYWSSGFASLFQMQLSISNYSHEWVPGESYEWVSRDNVIYCTYTVKDSTTLSMFMIDSTGVVKLLLWDYSYQQWIMLWAEPGNFCDVYSACGAFGVCNLLAVPFCQCLKGFQPSSLADWNNGFTSGGCVRMTSLQCEIGEEKDKFLEMPNMSFPSNPQALNVGKDDDCESACLKSCSCTAYAVSKSCNLWHGDLVNLKEHTDITAGVGTIYIRLSASELESEGFEDYG